MRGRLNEAVMVMPIRCHRARPAAWAISVSASARRSSYIRAAPSGLPSGLTATTVPDVAATQTAVTVPCPAVPDSASRSAATVAGHHADRVLFGPAGAPQADGREGLLRAGHHGTGRIADRDPDGGGGHVNRRPRG